MNGKTRGRWLLLITMLIVAAIACNTQAIQAPDVGAAVTGTMQALGTIAAGTLQPPADVVAAEPSATPEPPATDTPSVPPTATPTVAHLTQPGNPPGASSFISDRSSASLAGERRSIGDDFNRNWLERPFTSQVMDYQAHLDLTRAEFAVGAPWIYFTLYLEGLPPADSLALYGVEIDMDKDGRGDWLIVGAAPPDSTWTTNGVRAYRDTNNDVGSSTPMKADSPPYSGNGYDELVFDQGYGPDPDAAWIRRASSGANEIEIAVKSSLIGQYEEYLWGAWTDDGVKQPGWFDYHDYFSIADAGSPISDNSNYPLKALAAVDSTCRWGAGVTPEPDDPGVCPVPPTPTPTTPPPEGRIWGYVYRGTSSTYSGEGLSGVKVKLGQGSCSSTGYKSTTTGGDGSYAFNGLPPGDYCVTVSYSSLPHATYGWDPMSPNFGPGESPYRNVNDLALDEERGPVNFAFLEIIG
jgi:hypothetical protein